jgi:ABC-type sugar transport system substrate-binding protein
VIILKKIIVTFLIIIMSIFLFACNKTPEKKPEQTSPKIGVQFSVIEKDMFEVLKQNMQSFAKEKKIQLIFKETAKDYVTLEKNINELIKQNVKAIIIQFPPGDLIIDLARLILEKDIKLMAVGTLPPDVPVDGFIAPDNYRLGQLQGQYVVNTLSEQEVNAGKIILFELDQDDYAFSQMSKGTLDSLNNIQGIRTENYEINELQSQILKETADLQAVILQSSEMVVEAKKAINNNPKLNEIITVGYGAGKEASILISKGMHDAEADPILEMLARHSLQAVLDLIEKDTWQYDSQIASGSYDIPSKILPVRLIKKDNIFLLKERWGESIENTKSHDSKSNTEKNNNSQEESKSNNKDKENNNMKLKIKTKDGQSLEIDVPGEIEELEIKKSKQKE